MNITNAKKILAAASLTNHTVLMSGPHGCGKSTIVASFAKDHGFYNQPLFLSTQEVGDLIGMPRTIEQDGETLTTWSKATWLQRLIDYAWPTEHKFSDLSFSSPEFESKFTANLDKAYRPSDTITRETVNVAYSKAAGIPNIHHLNLVTDQMDIMCAVSIPSILFLDELNRAPIDVRQSSLQLVLERQIHEHKLPCVKGKPTLIVAAINPASDYQADELDPALIDRFVYIDIEADAKAWLEYARAKNLNDIVRAYIGEHPKDIFVHSKNDKDPIGATPRSWEKLADFVSVIDSIPAEVQFDIFKGIIGTTTASKFLTFMNNYSKVIKIADIEKAITAAKKKDPSLESVGKAVADIMKSQEAIQKSEMAEQFYAKYISKDANKAYPLMAYLYGMDIELLAAFLKRVKADNMPNYTKLASFDEPNGKALFKKIVALGTAATTK